MSDTAAEAQTAGETDPERAFGKRPLLRRWQPWLQEAGFAALVAVMLVPLWAVRYLPIQDLPQHLAAIRVLHSYGDPAFGFQRFFELQPFRTQYLTYYFAVDWLAHVFELVTANKLVVSAVVAGIPYAMRSLLRALGHEPALGVLVLPLLYSAHLILGFVNFLGAIALSLAGLSLAVRDRQTPTAGRATALGLVALLCFYTHVVPFGFLALGIALLSPGGGARAAGRRLLPLVPAALGAIYWLQQSPAGRATLQATTVVEADRGAKMQFLPWRRAIDDLPNWLTDVLRGDLDRHALVAWGGLWVLTLVVGYLTARKRPDALRLRLALLAPLAAVAYFVLPTSYAWIWPIAQRFPLLAALWSLLWLPPLRKSIRTAVVVAGALLAVTQSYDVTRAFVRFEDHEVGELDAAIARIPPRQRVAGLIFRRGSRYIKFSPFIHSVAYYQVNKGGAVMFTFADFPQSPFVFREDHRPPRVGPRWEWKPGSVVPARDLGWYDYVLVRGGPGRMAHADDYELLHRSRRWRVYQRVSP